MKLQKQSVGKVGNKEYHKFVVVIPNEAVEQSGFKEGEKLKAEVKTGEIRIRGEWNEKKEKTDKTI